MSRFHVASDQVRDLHFRIQRFLLKFGVLLRCGRQTFRHCRNFDVTLTAIDEQLKESMFGFEVFKFATHSTRKDGFERSRTGQVCARLQASTQV